MNENFSGRNEAFFRKLKSMTGLKILPFSCGRSALLSGLKALELSRMDEIFVPPFLCYSVLSTINRTAFPVMTYSERTKAIFVFHQFGFPQKMEIIEETALQNNWKIINDCANTIFSSYQDKKILGWGNFSILSFPKIYSCFLGGAFVSSHNNEILEIIETHFEILNERQADRANEAYEVLEHAANNPFDEESKFEIQAVFGYLPDLLAFPSKALESLPASEEEIKKDIARRRQLLSIVTSYFPKRVPNCPECDVVPSAIPISGENIQLECISNEIKEAIDVEVSILHFDFARNMLSPDYRKSIIIDCHKLWDEETVVQICEYLNERIA